MAAAAAADLRLRKSKSHEKASSHCICASEKINRMRKATLYCICASEKINRTRKSDITLQLPRLLRLSKKMQQRQEMAGQRPSA